LTVTLSVCGEQAAAVMVMVFVSAGYVARDWTRLERWAALNRAVRERRECVLSARFDDTPLPGLLSDMVTVDLRGGASQQSGASVMRGHMAYTPCPATPAQSGPSATKYPGTRTRRCGTAARRPGSNGRGRTGSQPGGCHPTA
jgi:hypothetical protein